MTRDIFITYCSLDSNNHHVGVRLWNFPCVILPFLEYFTKLKRGAIVISLIIILTHYHNYYYCWLERVRKKGLEKRAGVQRKEGMLFKLLRFYYSLMAPLISYLDSSFSYYNPLETLSQFHPGSQSLLWEIIFLSNLLSLIVLLCWSDCCAPLLLALNLILDGNIRQGRERKRKIK